MLRSRGMRRFVVAVTCGGLVGLGLLLAAQGCGSFSGSPEADARDETVLSDAPALEAEAAIGDGGSNRLTVLYATAFGSANDAGEAGAGIYPTGMVVEPSGGVALVGTYGYGAVDVGGAALPVPSGADAFLLRLDGKGAPVVALAFGENLDQYGATLAGTGNKLYASFQVSGTMNFTGVDLMSSNGVGTAFNSTTVRFDRSGVSAGNVPFRSTSNALVKGTALGAAESVISFGDWDQNLSVSGAPAVSRLPGKPGLFLVRSFVLSGPEIVRTNLCDDGTTCIAGALATNPQSGDSLAGGRYTGRITGVDGGIATAPNDNDGYVMKLDSNLDLQWVAALGGSGAQEVRAAASLLETDFVVAGAFDGTLDVPGKPTSTTRGKTDVFVARFDKAGSVLWVKTFGGAGTDLVRAMTSDASGNMFLVGQFNGPTIDVQGTTLTNADAPTGLGTSDIFVVWLDSAGNALYSARYGDGADDDAVAIGIDGTGNVAITGTFNRTIDFGAGTLTARGRTDMFVAKFMR